MDGEQRVRQGLKKIAEGGVDVHRGLAEMGKAGQANYQLSIRIRGDVSQDIHRVVKYVLGFLKEPFG